MKKFLLASVAGLALAIPTSPGAQGIYLRELVVIPVRPIDANTFEVIENDGAGGSQMWCAAGIFTRDYLNQRGGAIGVLQARAASAAYPGRKSVIFTTRPLPNAKSSYSEDVRTAGKTFSMGHASALCRSQPEYLIRVQVLSH
jgi:hypothetical protein